MNLITGIDHTLIGVSDLEAAKDAWKRLGFMPCPRGRHIGWGTANYCIMFPDDYIELLGIVDASLFTNNLDKFLEEREGLLGLAWSAKDEQAVAAAIPKAQAPKVLKRILEGPEGEELPEFGLVHYPPETTPGLRSFVCCHKTPEIVWRPEWLKHPNKAVGLGGVTLVCEKPSALAGAYEALLGAEAEGSGDEILIPAGRARVLLQSAEAFAARYGKAPLPCAGLPCLAAMTVKTASLAAAEGHLSLAGVAFTRNSRATLLVPAEQATGVVLEFVGA